MILHKTNILNNIQYPVPTHIFLLLFIRNVTIEDLNTFSKLIFKLYNINLGKKLRVSNIYLYIPMY